MTGTGKPSKPFYVNIGEQLAFSEEASAYYSMSGNLGGLPDFSPNYEPIKIPSHNNLGEQYIVKKGQSKHTISMPYSDIIDFRYIAHIFGGRLDQQLTLELVNIASGPFQADEKVTGAVSGAVGDVGSVSSDDITLKEFVRKELITGVTSSGYGILEYIKNDVMMLKNVGGSALQDEEEITGSESGARAKVDEIRFSFVLKKRSEDDFIIGETVTGVDSSATGVVTKIMGNDMEVTISSGVFQAEVINGATASATIVTFELNKLILKRFAASEEVAGGTSLATGDIPASEGIVYQHDLFVSPKVDPKSLAYVHGTITQAQHLLTGAVADDAEVKGVAGNAVITGSVKYKASSYTKDLTVDSEQAVSTILQSYEYCHVDFSLDGDNYDHKAKAFSIAFSRGHSDVPTFADIDPKGYGSSAFGTKPSFEIHKEDFALLDLMVAGTTFTTTITLRKIALKHEAIFTMSNSLHAYPIKDADNIILVTISPEVHGVPTVVIRDKIANYN